MAQTPQQAKIPHTASGSGGGPDRSPARVDRPQSEAAPPMYVRHPGVLTTVGETGPSAQCHLLNPKPHHLRSPVPVDRLQSEAAPPLTVRHPGVRTVVCGGDRSPVTGRTGLTTVGETGLTTVEGAGLTAMGETSLRFSRLWGRPVSDLSPPHRRSPVPVDPEGDGDEELPMPAFEGMVSPLSPLWALSPPCLPPGHGLLHVSPLGMISPDPGKFSTFT